ncbi:MAG: MBL fold metallo-hydrolase [Myxococcales bacterium]|nr:MBL fold metallo-hydrolase [Myxococcales bacterium]
MTELQTLTGNTQRLDGGAMFGNCPRALWAQWCPPDDENRILLACRSLLVREDSGRCVLLEAGIGAFFEPRLRERFGVQEAEHLLLRDLAARGLAPEDIDVIVLSHLHFDHAGGLLTPWSEGQASTLAFPRARYVVSEGAWARARAPHPRDRASFIPELQGMLAATGRLELVDGERSATLGDGYRFTFSEGHTPGLMLTTVERGPEGPVTFCGDLIPGAPWVHLPITMGYDRFPELLIDEKTALLARVEAERSWLCFTHDPEVAACRVARDERGRYRAVDVRHSVGAAS